MEESTVKTIVAVVGIAAVTGVALYALTQQHKRMKAIREDAARKVISIHQAQDLARQNHQRDMVALRKHREDMAKRADAVMAVVTAMNDVGGFTDEACTQVFNDFSAQRISAEDAEARIRELGSKPRLVLAA